ncbi:MAG: DEAD/DEAH box helicase, partial [Anaerolineaceae bacterium]|nr:DEAD/DEAH box helicase [Anaerolineaceae bacterium]
MPNFVRVAVNVPQVNGVFDYHLPSELDGLVLVGCLVVVPFGKQLVQGIVVERMNEASVSETRAVEALLDAKPVVTPVQMRLALWMEEQYLTHAAQALDLMLPPGLSQLADTAYHIHPSAIPARDLSPLQQRVFTAIQERGSMRGRQLDNAFPHVNVRAAAQALARRGMLISQPVLAPPTVRPKFIRTAQLACPPENVTEVWDSLSRAGSAAQGRRKTVLEFLLQEPEPVNVAWVYASAPGSSLTDLQALEDLGLVRLSESEIWRDPLEKITWVPQQAPVLTAEQSIVWDQLYAILQQLRSSEKAPAPILLHGVTGSGKTELYLRAVEEVIRQGKQAIILVPEISLTPQTVRRFLARFPGQVGLVHSKLSPGERYDTWRRAREGRLPVIVGPRSALFTPLSKLGLVVVDECHDDSYYQDDFAPAYDAVETALALARLAGAAALLGSATPSVNQRYHAETKKWNLLRLPNRILAHKQAVQSQLENLSFTLPELESDLDAAHLPLPPVQIVDMRQELKA